MVGHKNCMYAKILATQFLTWPSTNSYTMYSESIYEARIFHGIFVNAFYGLLDEIKKGL